MNIGFVTPEFPHPKTGSAGGIGTSIFNLSKGLSQLGNKVYVFIYGQSKDEIIEEDFFTIYRIKNIRLGSLTRFLTQKKVQSIINQLVKDGKIDIVEFAEWTGFSSFINLKCPNVIRLNGSDTYFCHLDGRKVKFQNFIEEKMALKKANGLISVSQYTAAVTQQLFKLNKSFEIIPNSIDTVNFTNQNETSEKENTILYFGTLIRKKGLLELPLIFNEIYKKNQNAKLILIGRDASDIISRSKSTWDLMKNLFDEDAFLNVHYLGSVTYEDIRKHICEATVCVFPTFAEALPVSWIEAMALKKAIVASDIGWAKEVVDDEKQGFLVNPKNHKLYAEKIINLLNNDSLRSEFGTAANKKVKENFSIEVVAKLSEDYYKNVLNQNND